MKKSLDEFWSWVQRNKKKLALAGLTITAIAGLAVGIRNKEAVAKLWGELCLLLGESPAGGSLPESSAQVIEVASQAARPRPYTLPQESFAVSSHIRTLSAGMRHSAGKAAEAEALGIKLQPNQTLVSSYTKYAA